MRSSSWPWLVALGAVGCTRGGVAPAPALGDDVLLVVADPGFQVQLTDLAGRELHRWEVVPEDHGVDGSRGSFRRAWLQPDGSLLALIEYGSLWLIERDGSVRWVIDDGNHHDVLARAEGGWHSLVEEPTAQGTRDLVVSYDADGHEESSVDVRDAIARSPGQELFAERVAATADDPLHLNALNAVTVPGDDRFPEGAWLLSSRAQNALFVLDPAVGLVTWSGVGDFVGQHDPRLLGPDRVLLLDNGTRASGTRAIELSFPSLATWWTSVELPYSSCCGTVQRVGDLTRAVLTPSATAVVLGADGDLVEAWTPPEVDRLFQAEQLPRPAWLSEDLR